MILNVAYSSDNNYAPYLGISMLSMLENNSDDFESIHIFIIDNGISSDNMKKLKSIAKDYGATISFVKLDELCVGLKTDGSFSKSSFGRIFLSRLPKIEKIIYLDSDSIVLGSFKELCQSDMTDCYVAGVQDNVYPFFKEMIDIPKKTRYINAGFLLVNLTLWRKDHLEEKCIATINRFHGSVPHHDQGVINHVCAGRIKILHPKYNVQPPMFYLTSRQIKTISNEGHYYSDTEIKDACKKPIFVHFTTDVYNRPWFSPCSHPLADCYYDYMIKSPWGNIVTKKKLPFKTRVTKLISRVPLVYTRVYVPIVRFEKRIRIKRRLKH